MGIRAILVDDERLARRAMARLLLAHPQVEVVGEADSVDGAWQLLEQLQPELVFLDVQLAGETGFDLFKRGPVKARVIFVTAWEQFAVRAFEVNALDYLLKPVTPERLALALDRAGRLTPIQSNASLSLDDVLCLTTSQGLKFFAVRDIQAITAQDDYSGVQLTSGGELLSPTPLKDWEQRLPPGFLRIHRSAIVQVAEVQAVSRLPGGSYEVRLTHGATRLMISRRYAAEILARLQHKLVG